MPDNKKLKKKLTVEEQPTQLTKAAKAAGKTSGKAEGKEKHWAIEEMHADHILPGSKGGHTTLENGQMLCRDHNLAKSAK